jgi:hypothetical protein
MTSRSSTSTAAATPTPTPREQALLKEIEALKTQLAQQQPKTPAAPPVLNRAAAEAALIDFLSDPASMAAEIERLLVHFPVTSSSARVFYETLLDDVKPSTLPSVIAKIRALQRHRIWCPREVWRKQRKLEALQLSVSELGEWGTARLLVALYQATDAPRPSCDDLYSKLDRSDQLLLVHALNEYGLPLGLSPRLAKQIPLVHYARHGSTSELNEQIKWLQSRDLIQSEHNGFPMLFQPLIEMHPGWLDRLRLLLEAGARGDVIYVPWNCTALHMLCYTKTGRASAAQVSEELLVQAARLLVEHGARSVLNVADVSRTSSVQHRTALMQAAAAGRFQVGQLLLELGADASIHDNQGNTVLDILFYLKHSDAGVHRQASAGYSCMDLYGLVNRFHLGELINDELREDCRSCGTCRYLLASVALYESDDDEELDEKETAASESDDAIESNTTTEGAQTDPVSATAPMSISGVGRRFRLAQPVDDVLLQLHKLVI